MAPCTFLMSTQVRNHKSKREASSLGLLVLGQPNQWHIIMAQYSPAGRGSSRPSEHVYENLETRVLHNASIAHDSIVYSTWVHCFIAIAHMAQMNVRFTVRVFFEFQK